MPRTGFREKFRTRFNACNHAKGCGACFVKFLFKVVVHAFVGLSVVNAIALTLLFEAVALLLLTLWAACDAGEEGVTAILDAYHVESSDPITQVQFAGGEGGQATREVHGPRSDIFGQMGNRDERCCTRCALTGL